MTLVFIPRHISELKIPFGKEIAMKISKKLIINKSLYICGRNCGDLGFFRNDRFPTLYEPPTLIIPDYLGETYGFVLIED